MKETKRECEWIVYKNEKRGKMKAMEKKKLWEGGGDEWETKDSKE